MWMQWDNYVIFFWYNSRNFSLNMSYFSIIDFYTSLKESYIFFYSMNKKTRSKLEKRDMPQQRFLQYFYTSCTGLSILYFCGVLYFFNNIKMAPAEFLYPFCFWHKEWNSKVTLFFSEQFSDFVNSNSFHF